MDLSTIIISIGSASIAFGMVTLHEGLRMLLRERERIVKNHFMFAAELEAAAKRYGEKQNLNSILTKEEPDEHDV